MHRAAVTAAPPAAATVQEPVKESEQDSASQVALKPQSSSESGRAAGPNAGHEYSSEGFVSQPFLTIHE